MLPLRLKEETKHHHAQLEKNMMGRIRAIKDIGDYVSLLGIIHGYYSSLDVAIRLHLLRDRFPDISRRQRSDVILDDMNQLLPGSVSGPLCLEIPRINSICSALGALYVLEGSTLGGGIVAQIISGKINADRGFSFFRSYGKDVPEMWSTFIDYLKQGYTESEHTEIIEAAKETFLTFNDWLIANEKRLKL